MFFSEECRTTPKTAFLTSPPGRAESLAKLSGAAGSQDGVRGLSKHLRWSKWAGSEDSQGQMCKEYEGIHTSGPVDAGQKASGPTFCGEKSFVGCQCDF